MLLEHVDKIIVFEYFEICGAVTFSVWKDLDTVLSKGRENKTRVSRN